MLPLNLVVNTYIAFNARTNVFLIRVASSHDFRFVGLTNLPCIKNTLLEASCTIAGWRFCFCLWNMMDRTFALVSHELASVRDLIKESAMSSTSILPRVYGTCWYETLASLVRAPCHPFEDMARFLESACRKWCSPGFLDIRLLSMGDRDTFTFSVSHMAVPLYRDERGRAAIAPVPSTLT